MRRGLHLTASFSKTIYGLWAQGVHNAPELVRTNFDRWAELNPDYELKILDEDGLRALLAEVAFEPHPGMRIQAISNIARIHLLSLTGGVWADASLFPTVPLNAWLPERLACGGFYAFERPGPDRPISNWFLAAEKGSLIVERMRQAVRRYWIRGRELRSEEDGPVIPEDPVAMVAVPEADHNPKYPYFWFHYSFRFLLEREPEFAALWRSCAPLHADQAHALQYAFAESEPSSDAKVRSLLMDSPVHKLDWRREYDIGRLVGLAGSL